MVKSGDSVVRYVGFLVGGEMGAVAGKTALRAAVRYEINSSLKDVVTVYYSDPPPTLSDFVAQLAKDRSG